MSLDVMLTEGDREVYSANYTHNAASMAIHAACYYAIWRPDELGITTASELAQQLSNALVSMALKRDDLLPLEPENGWGSLDGFIDFVAKYLAACCKHPNATVSVSR